MKHAAVHAIRARLQRNAVARQLGTHPTFGMIVTHTAAQAIAFDDLGNPRCRLGDMERRRDFDQTVHDHRLAFLVRDAEAETVMGAGTGIDESGVHMPGIIRPRRDAGIDRRLDQLAADEGRFIVTPLAQIIGPRRFRVLVQCLVDIGLRQQRIEHPRRRMNHQHLAGLLAEVPGPAIIGEAGAAICSSDADQHRFPAQISL
jgi:hypothetical protein